LAVRQTVSSAPAPRPPAATCSASPPARQPASQLARQLAARIGARTEGEGSRRADAKDPLREAKDWGIG